MSEKELVELIVNLIEPESWKKRADVKCLAVRGALVVRHTDAVHRQIGDLLAHLNVVSITQPSPPPAAGSGRRGGFF